MTATYFGKNSDRIWRETVNASALLRHTARASCPLTYSRRTRRSDTSGRPAVSPARQAWRKRRACRVRRQRPVTDSGRRGRDASRRPLPSAAHAGGRDASGANVRHRRAWMDGGGGSCFRVTRPACSARRAARQFTESVAVRRRSCDIRRGRPARSPIRGERGEVTRAGGLLSLLRVRRGENGERVASDVRGPSQTAAGAVVTHRGALCRQQPMRAGVTHRAPMCATAAPGWTAEAVPAFE